MQSGELVTLEVGSDLQSFTPEQLFAWANEHQKSLLEAGLTDPVYDDVIAYLAQLAMATDGLVILEAIVGQKFKTDITHPDTATHSVFDAELTETN